MIRAYFLHAQNNNIVTLGVFADESGTEAQAYLAAVGLSKFIGAHTFDASIGALHGVKAPGVTVLKKVGILYVTSLQLC